VDREPLESRPGVLIRFTRGASCRALASTLLPDSILVRPRRILLELLAFFQRRVFLEIGHFGGIIVSGQRLVVHAQA